MFGRRRNRATTDGAPAPKKGWDGGSIKVDRDVQLWVRTAGEGPETVLVPCCGNHPDFVGLERDGRRVVYYDVRNRGRSSSVDDLAKIGFEEDVSDMGTVCDELGLEKVSIFGWSYLAGVAARHSLSDRDRVERLVLASGIPIRTRLDSKPVPEPPPHVLAHLDQLEAQGVPSKDPERWCREWREAYVPMRMGIKSAFGNMSSPCDLPNEQPAHVARSMVCIYAGLTVYDWGPDMRGLDLPVLLVHGTSDVDPVEVAEEWLDVLGDSRLLVIEGAGQLPWVEAPERFFHTVNRFLAGEAV